MNRNEDVFPIWKQDKIQLEKIQQPSIDTSLLIEYAPRDLVFYKDEFYKSQINSISYIVFGRDVNYFYTIDERTQYVYLICDNELIFCNTSFEKFAICHNKFYKFVRQMRLADIIIPNIDTLDLLEQQIENYDSKAMEEDAYWTVSLYELSEGFFRLDDNYPNQLLKMVASLKSSR